MCGWEGDYCVVCRVGRSSWWCGGHAHASFSLRKTLSPTVQLYMIVPLTGLVVGLVHPLRYSWVQSTVADLRSTLF